MIRGTIVSKAFILTFFLLCYFSFSYAQQGQLIVQGSVWEKNRSDKEVAVSGAKVSHTRNVFTFSEKDGRFSITLPDTASFLIIAFDHIGKDTIRLTNLSKELKLVYPYHKAMNEVTIRQKRFSTEISLLTPQKVERIGAKELLKAACCNLGESFETTPSVDVAFTDAITGYRQIQLLGLAGPYTLITRENIPEVRGLASITGLTFTPGQWIENMQLSKGSGSVVNGYEGLAGQINIELRKPMEGDEQFYNLYQSNQGRSEGNAYIAFEPKEGLYSNVFLHGKSQWLKIDQNKDHFIDQPLGQSWIGANRWMWLGKKGRELQFGVKYNYTDNWGGHEHYDGKENPEKSHTWGMNMRTNRVDTWAKIGKLFTAKPWKSMGLQLAFSNHQQDMQFGRKQFDAKENTYYANYIFQSIIGNTNRVIKMGASFNTIDRQETIQASPIHVQEIVPGIFSEYAHTFSPKLNAVIGVRLDYHNLYGLYFTPRVHLRYAPYEQLAIRASAGKAYRTASILSENISYFSTNRLIHVIRSQSDGAYGLQNEEAYNTGVNATYKFKLGYRPGSVSVDYYYTHFINQVLADWESTRSLSFYNSTRPSYAHSMQVQLDYSIKRKMDVRLAYRFHDVRATYNNTLLQRPLNARQRAFINYSYETRSKWSFDYTIQWIGPKRIPSTEANPESLRLNTTSPSFITMNAHVNKALKNGFECYAGVENMLNYMQQNPIIDATNPFGSYFDGSLIWGPVMGRAFYMGVRYKVKRKIE